MLNKKNADVVRAMKAASQIATSNTKPYFEFIEASAFAIKSKGIGNRDDFVAMLDASRTAKGEPSLLDSKRSEAWSCAELGTFECVKPLFANMRKLPALPGLGGLYDIACAIRGKGPFGKGKDLEDDALDWKTNNENAPSVDDLANALRLGNKQRNKGKVAKPQETLDKYCGAVIKYLQMARDGKITKRGPDGKAMKHGDDTVKLPAVTGAVIQTAIDALQALKDQQSKAVPIPHAKIAARRKRIAQEKSQRAA
jgi:hypothetical protein